MGGRDAKWKLREWNVFSNWDFSETEVVSKSGNFYFQKNILGLQST